jgi:hypothetical protein
MLGFYLRRLPHEDFEELICGAAVVTSDAGGPKLFRRPDGRMVKLFRRRKLISSSLIWPVAVRFCRAARRLSALGIPSVAVEASYRVPTAMRHVVVYREIPGVSLREALRVKGRIDVLLEMLAKLLATLHAKGVYFRALHFGNVLVREDGMLALVDVSECRFRRAPLRPELRARNFKPLFSYDEDTAVLGKFGFERFLQLYLALANLNDGAQGRFLLALSRLRLEMAEAALSLLSKG